MRLLLLLLSSLSLSLVLLVYAEVQYGVFFLTAFEVFLKLLV